MNLQEAKHWFYQLKREEKIIVKALLRLKKLEQKKKLKKLSKQWKIENEHNIDVDYIKYERESKDEDDVIIPKQYTNINEFLFFGDDTEFMCHYKRTCKNILLELNRFFGSNKQTIRRGIARNTDVIFTEVKMNRACSVVYAWWEAPYLVSSSVLTGSQLDEIYKKIQLNLSQSVPYIKGVLTRTVGLKYAPEIRFFRDDFMFEIESYEDHLNEIKSKEDPKLSLDKNSSPVVNKMKAMTLEYFENKNKTLEPELREGEDKDHKEHATDRILKSSNLIYKLTTGQNTEIDDTGVSSEDETKKLSKRATRVQKTFKKFLRSNNIEEKDLIKKPLDSKSAMLNYLNNYDRKVPGSFSSHFSFRDQEEQMKKSDQRDIEMKKAFEQKTKKDIRDSRRLLVKPKTKKNKTEEFWKNLDNA